MDPQKITALAELLRKNGDKVLSSESKLILTGSLLRALNDSFTLIADSTELASKQSFQVVKPNSSKSNVFRDLQLVHDFVQKTVFLCITHYLEDDDFDGVIDISKFKSLKRLEVKRINIKQIVGIQSFRSQIQHLVCNRSLRSVVEIIEHCGGDESNGFLWNELKVADFSYNNLKTVDNSLEFAQYLQHLNLRHNKLESVKAIKWLPNLKTLDLSFNRLTSIPCFHVETSKRLQYINFSNNLIENLIGVSKLDLLTEIDLSNNCLLDHNSLYPLGTLVNLKYLNLYGNPLYYHPKHRLATAQFLHKDTCTVKFTLNCEPLSKSEKALTGTHLQNNHSKNRMQNNSVCQFITSKQSSCETPISSVGSQNSVQQNSSIEDGAYGSNYYNSRKTKRFKVREVVIEPSEPLESDSPAKSDLRYFDENLKSNKIHLETKQQFQVLRNKYGAGWLQNENAKVMSSMLDLNETNENINSNPNIEILTNQVLKSFVNFEKNNVPKDISTSTAITNNKENTNSFSFCSYEKEQSENLLDSTPHLENIFTNAIDNLELSDPEDDEESYIVHTLKKNEPILLTISSKYIREKETSNENRTKAKWSLKILQSCDRVKSNTLRINFDTIKTNKKERIYIIEEGLCQELEKKLRTILSTRDLYEMNQKLFRCINCSCQFSEENILGVQRSHDIFCPDCKSTYVTEIQTLSTCLYKNPNTTLKKDLKPFLVLKEAPQISNFSQNDSENNRNENTGRSLFELPTNNVLRSINSLNESSSCSKISQSEDSLDSTQSAVGSCVIDRENDFKINCESDVDIISNPSQSSIEILDHMNSSRKNSDDRKTSHLSNSQQHISITLDDIQEGPNILKTIGKIKKYDIEEKNQTNALLNKSTSSDSVINIMSTVQGSSGTPKQEDTKMSAMFGGLLQSTNMLMSRTTQRLVKSENSSFESYNFNFIDFGDVDHRLKFYFYQAKFDEHCEHFKWIVKGKLYIENSQKLICGIIVMSTVKLYIMEEFGPENNNISKWLRTVVSVTVDRLESIGLLPWKVGLNFTLRDWGGFLLLFQDILRTDNLLFYFTKNTLPEQCDLNYDTSEKVLQRISETLKEDELKMFSLLRSCDVIGHKTTINFLISGFFITDSRIFITSSNLSWLTPALDATIEIGRTQLISNVVDFEWNKANIFIIHFHDETKNISESWKCIFETSENAETCLTSIGKSWEQLFGVSFLKNK